MALQELYGDYKPQGLVGGMVSGLNTGASLGNMFANTASTNQQTTAREQKLPWELAQSAANVDRDVMANDMTRATQPGAIDATNAANKTAIMTNEQAQQLIPFQTFNKMFREQSQQVATMFTEASREINRGNYDAVFEKISNMAQKPEEKEAILKVYQQFKGNPQGASAYAKQIADRAMQDLINTNEEKVFEMWKIAAQNAARLKEHQVQAGSVQEKRPSDAERNINDIANYVREEFKGKGWTEARIRAEAIKRYYDRVQTMTDAAGKPIGVGVSKGPPVTGSGATGRWGGGTAPVQQNSNIIKLD